MLKVEHIGIAVKELATSIPLFEKLLNSHCYKTELVESEQVNTAFFKQGDYKKALNKEITKTLRTRRRSRRLFCICKT